MKVMFCITKGNFGGAQKYVFDLATNLPTNKFEVVVAFGEGEMLQKKLTENGIRTIKIDCLERELNYKNDWQSIKKLIAIIKEEEPNIIHLNSSKIGFLGSLAVLYLKILNLFGILDLNFTTLFTSHGWAFNEKHRTFWSKLIFYIAHYITILICNNTIAVSNKTKKDITFLPFIKNKIKVIYNGIKTKDVENWVESNLIKKDFEDQTLLISLSELHKNKGIDIAIRAISLLPQNILNNIKYVVAGEGEERENLENMAKELNIQEKIIFLGFVENAKSLIPYSDIFIMPSRTENLPFALLEAGSYNKPIIATSVGGIPEIIKDMDNGILVHPEKPKELSEAIKYLIENKEKREHMAHKIKDKIKKNFSFEKTLKETINLYQTKIK